MHAGNPQSHTEHQEVAHDTTLETEFTYPLNYYPSILQLKLFLKYLGGRMEGTQAGPSPVPGASRVGVEEKPV